MIDPSPPSPHPQTAGERRGRRVAWGVAIAAVLAARLIWLGSRLSFPDLVADYPFLGGDGLDWIQNGLARAGHPVRPPDRSPLLPLVLAALERLDALAWFPLVNQLAPSAGLAAFACAVWRWHGPRIAFLATLAPALSAVATRSSIEVMADTLAAVLLFLAILAFLGGARRPALHLAAGLLGALSALAQSAALLLPLVLAFPLLAGARPRGLRRLLPALLGGALFAALALPPIVANAWRAWRVGAVGTATRQWSLLEPSLDQLPFYAGAAAGLWGLPALLLAGAGLAALLRAGRSRGWLLLGLVLVIGGFFVLLYDWEAQRFLLYLHLPVALAAAAGLALLQRPAAQVVAGLVAALWSAWPLPGPEHHEARFLVWPLPTAVADSRDAPHWRVTPVREAWEAGVWRRVETATSRRPPGPRLPRDPLPGARAVVLLGSADRQASFVSQKLLSSLLRRKVALAPAELLPTDWWGWRRRRYLGEAGGFALFELRLPGARGPYLVAFLPESPGWRELAAGAGQGPPSPAPCRARAWRTARRLAALADADRGAPGDPFLAVLARSPPGDWERLVPFAVGTSRLVVLVGEEAAEARRELVRRPRRAVWRGEEARVVDGELWEWRSLVAVPARSASDCPPVPYSP